MNFGKLAMFVTCLPNFGSVNLSTAIVCAVLISASYHNQSADTVQQITTMKYYYKPDTTVFSNLCY